MSQILNESISPIALLKIVLRHWELIKRMIWRDVVARYKGSFFGFIWSFFNPFLMLGIYTFVFAIVFQARWGGEQNGFETNFTVVLFVGLIFHAFFAEVIGRAPNIITQNENYVKKVIFPLEILPIIYVGSAVFTATVSFVVLVFVYFLLVGLPYWTVLYAPITFMPFIPLTLGMGWILSSLGVYLRDINQIIGSLITALLFLSPVLYPVSTLPQKIQLIIYLNPLTFPIEQARAVIIFNQNPDWSGTAIYSLVSCLICYTGYVWFQKTRKGFADVI